MKRIQRFATLFQPPRNSREQEQLRQSSRRHFGRWIRSQSGETAWIRMTSLSLMLFCSMCTWIACAQIQTNSWRLVIANVNLTVLSTLFDGRCVGFANLAANYPDQYPLPSYCVDVLRRIHEAPPPERLDLDDLIAQSRKP